MKRKCNAKEEAYVHESESTDDKMAGKGANEIKEIKVKIGNKFMDETEVQCKRGSISS
jgi:hypothetical protein